MFKMKKFASLAIAGFAAVSMFACSDDDNGGDEDSLAEFADVALGTKASDGTYPIEGTVTAKSEESVITKISGTAKIGGGTADAKYVTFTASKEEDAGINSSAVDFATLELKLIPTCPEGKKNGDKVEAVITITATVDGESESTEIEQEVDCYKMELEDGMFILGGGSNTSVGSFLDLDFDGGKGKVYKSGDLTDAIRAELDLEYTGTAFEVYEEEQSYIWKVNGEIDMDATIAELGAFWLTKDEEDSETSVTVAVDDVLLVETSDMNAALIEVTEKDGQTTITVKTIIAYEE